MAYLYRMRLSGRFSSICAILGAVDGNLRVVYLASSGLHFWNKILEIMQKMRGD